MPETPIVVALMFPSHWDNRPPEALERNVAQLRSLSPRIEVIDERYADSDDLRLRRGQDPTLDLRHEAVPVSAAVRETLGRAEVVLAQDLPFDLDQLAPRLRWVQGVGAGISQLQSAGLPSSSARLTSAAGANSTAIAEFVLARILQFSKRLPEIDDLMRSHRWQPTYGTQIAGRTITVVGLGAIGRRVADVTRALGMRVHGVRRDISAGAEQSGVDALFSTADLHAAVAQSDVVVAAVPESPESRDMFDAALFASMAPDSIFINVGRGSAVNEEDLVDSLTSGRLRAAALDVVKDEPLPGDHPLWQAPNLFLSPHSAASPDEHWSGVFTLFNKNMERYLAGEALLNEIR